MVPWAGSKNELICSGDKGGVQRWDSHVGVTNRGSIHSAAGRIGGGRGGIWAGSELDDDAAVDGGRCSQKRPRLRLLLRLAQLLCCTLRDDVLPLGLGGLDDGCCGRPFWGGCGRVPRSVRGQLLRDSGDRVRQRSVVLPLFIRDCSSAMEKVVDLQAMASRRLERGWRQERGAREA
jgi:hypothetical protein